MIGTPEIESLCWRGGSLTWLPNPRTSQKQTKIPPRSGISARYEAGAYRFELQLTDPESVVLPLDEAPIVTRNQTGS